MGKKRIWLGITIGVAVILAGVAALLFIAKEPWQPEPVTLQILGGEVGVYDAPNGKLLGSANGTRLESGNFIKAGQNSSAAVAYFETSTIKVDSLTEVQHLWSRSQKQQSSLISQGKFYLTQFVRRLSGKNTDRLPGIGRSIALEVLYGKITVSAARQNSPGSLFEVWTPGGVAAVHGTVFTVDVDPEKGTFVETYQGTVRVGIITVDDQMKPVLAVVTLKAGETVALPPLPKEWRQDAKIYSQLMALAREIVEQSLEQGDLDIAIKGASLLQRDQKVGAAIYALEGITLPAAGKVSPPAFSSGYTTQNGSMFDGMAIVLAKANEVKRVFVPSARAPQVPKGPPVKREKPPAYISAIGGIPRPLGVAVDPENHHIFVTESSGSHTTKCFAPDGTFLFELVPPGTQPGNRMPSYVAVDARSGTVFVSDRYRHVIDVYDADGAYLWIFTPANDPDISWSPLGLSVANGYLYVTDITDTKHRVLVIDLSSAELKMEFGKEGKELGEFAFPNDAIADLKGQIYVTDGNNFRIQTFDANGLAIGDFSRWGLGGMGLPRGTAIEGNYLYVVDTFDQAVHIYNVETSVRQIFTFGRGGISNGEFNFPNDIAIDRNRLYVADTQNNRIQIWGY